MNTYYRYIFIRKSFRGMSYITYISICISEFRSFHPSRKFSESVCQTSSPEYPALLRHGLQCHLGLWPDFRSRDRNGASLARRYSASCSASIVQWLQSRWPWSSWPHCVLQTIRSAFGDHLQPLSRRVRCWIRFGFLTLDHMFGKSISLGRTR